MQAPRTSEKSQISHFTNSLKPKWSLSNSSYDFWQESNFTKFYSFLILANVFLGVGTPCGYTDGFPREKHGIQVRSIYPNRGILIENLWPAKPAGKIQQKVSSVNSIQWKTTLNYFWSNTSGKVKKLTKYDSTSWYSS